MDTKSATYREIQSECKRLRLRAVGTREELIRRLETFTSYNQNPATLPSQQHPEPQQSHPDHAESEDGEGTPEPPTSTQAPKKQAASGKPQDEIGDCLVERAHGHRSIDLLALLESSMKTLETSKQQRQWREKELANQQLLLNSLDKALRSVTISLGPYHHERNRFLSMFKKEKLGRATQDDLKIIADGKLLARGGDAATDAILYEGTRGRRDFTTFEKLYGLQPETVRKIHHSETFVILNTHARVLASHTETGSPAFYNLFKNFIQLFTESGIGCDEGYLVGDATEVTKAYWAFMSCIKTEVTGVIRRSEKL